VTNPTLIWWALLSAVALLNLVMWGIAARLFWRRNGALAPAVRATRQWLLWLAAVYVLGCAFRSFLPMVDAPRICLYETELSRIVIGRSVATVAELCFAAQFALLLGEASRATSQRLVAYIGRSVLPLIVVAEVFSWSAVLTRNYLLHAIENSLWMLAAFVTVAAFTSVRSAFDERARSFLAAVVLFGAGYIGFMVVIDVPMYLSRWQASMAAGKAPLSALAGIQEIVASCRVVRDWAVWREEVPWLSLYFSTAVWASIFLSHAPPLVAPAPVGAGSGVGPEPGR